MQHQFLYLRRLWCTPEGCDYRRTEEGCPNSSASPSLWACYNGCFHFTSHTNFSIFSFFCDKQFLSCSFFWVKKRLSDKRWSLSFSSFSPTICSRATQVESSSSSGRFMLFMLLVQHLPKQALSRSCPHDASTIQSFLQQGLPQPPSQMWLLRLAQDGYKHKQVS